MVKWSKLLNRRAWRLWWQRRWRGWDDSVTWDLDTEIATFILPRLKRFRELTQAIPFGETQKSWYQKLDMMIFAFDALANRWSYRIDLVENEPLIEEGRRLFHEFFYSLWW